MTIIGKIHNRIQTRIRQVKSSGPIFGVGRKTQSAVSASEQAPQTIQPKVRTADILNKDLTVIANKYGVTLEEIKKLLADGNSTEEDLLKATSVEYEKIKSCLDAALKDSIVDGKVDLQAALKSFAEHKVKVLHEEKSLAEAKQEVKQEKDMDLYDALLKKCKELGGRPIEEVSDEELKEALKKVLLEMFSEAKRQEWASKDDAAKKAAMDTFNAMLLKCSPEEKAKMFRAICKLLCEEDMKDLAAPIYQNTLAMLTSEKADLKVVAEFIDTVGEDFFKGLGFSDKEIAVIKQITFSELPPDKLKLIAQNILNMLKSISPDELKKTLEILAKIENGTKLEELSPEELALYNKNKQLIGNVIAFITGAIENQKISEAEKQEILAPILGCAQELGVADLIYGRVDSFIRQTQDMNVQIDSNEIAKFINKMTKNAYSEAIGDNNPDNLYRGDGADSSSGGFGFAQRISQEGFWAAMSGKYESTQKVLATEIKDANIYVLSNAADKKESVSLPWQKYQSVKNLNAKDVHDGLINNHIKFSDLLDNYKDLTHSAKFFVNKLIEIKSPAEQSYILDGVSNHEAIEIIKQAKLNPEDLKIALDYASKKELERMEKEKEEVRL